MRALEDLLALQQIDIQIDQARHRRRHLPQRAELAGLAERMAGTGAKAAEAERLLGDLETRRAAAEAELAGIEDRMRTIDRRLYDGSVGAAKDLQAMTAELSHLRERASGLEDMILALLEESAPLEKSIDVLRGEHAAASTSHSEAEERLVAAEAEIDNEIDRLMSARSEAASGIDAALMDTYERLRSRLGGVGVARLVGNHCDGCHLTLSAAELERVRRIGEGEVYCCEQCSRILVP